jgi:hypothetical protein
MALSKREWFLFRLDDPKNVPCYELGESKLERFTRMDPAIDEDMGLWRRKIPSHGRTWTKRSVHRA